MSFRVSPHAVAAPRADRRKSTLLNLQVTRRCRRRRRRRRPPRRCTALLMVRALLVLCSSAALIAARRDALGLGRSNSWQARVPWTLEYATSNLQRVLRAKPVTSHVRRRDGGRAPPLRGVFQHRQYLTHCRRRHRHALAAAPIASTRSPDVGEQGPRARPEGAPPRPARGRSPAKTSRSRRGGRAPRTKPPYDDGGRSSLGAAQPFERRGAARRRRGDVQRPARGRRGSPRGPPRDTRPRRRRVGRAPRPEPRPRWAIG